MSTYLDIPPTVLFCHREMLKIIIIHENFIAMESFPGNKQVSIYLTTLHLNYPKLPLFFLPD